MLNELQFNEKSIRYIPVSGLSGENIVSLSQDCPLKSWYLSLSIYLCINALSHSNISICRYDGPTFIEAIDTFKIPPRNINKPCRCIVTSVLTENNKGCDVIVSVVQGI
jgi:translation elongation factor EF-1alpha